MRKKKEKRNKCKLNSTENIIPKQLADVEISHEDFTTILNEEEKVFYTKRKY